MSLDWTFLHWQTTATGQVSVFYFYLCLTLLMSLSLHMGGSCKSALPTLCPHAVGIIKSLNRGRRLQVVCNLFSSSCILCCVQFREAYFALQQRASSAFFVHCCCKYWGCSHSLLQSPAMSLENFDSDAFGIYWVCTGFSCGSCSCMFFFLSPHFLFGHNSLFVNSRKAVDCIFVLLCLYIIFVKIKCIYILIIQVFISF